MRRILPTLFIALLLSGMSWAEENRHQGSNLGTDVIGSQEAPTVLNVVPWKDREVKLDRKDATSSLLDRVLEPLDQDVLMREVQYYQLLNARTEQEGLFLD